jgi:hypothetical protein
MRRLIALAVLLLLAGCAGMRPFEPPQPDEIPPGPGLFTGKKGELVITPPLR